jgi:hypothetical protein
VLVASLETGTPVPDAHFARAREIAARRVHQGGGARVVPTRRAPVGKGLLGDGVERRAHRRSP